MSQSERTAGPVGTSAPAPLRLNRAPWNTTIPLVLHDRKELRAVHKHQVAQFKEMRYEHLLGLVPDKVARLSIEVHVGKRTGLLGITVEKWEEDSIVVLVHRSLGLRWWPALMIASSEGFRKWRDGKTRELTRHEYQHYE